MINGNLREFVGNVMARGQVGYGDVRRLQRDYLPGGVTNREELELLSSLNATLVRADKTWAKWFVPSVAEFVCEREAQVQEPPIKESASEWVGRLVAASSTRLGRKIARQVRCELGRRQGVPSSNSDQAHPNGMGGHDIQRNQAGEPETERADRSGQIAKPACRESNKSTARREARRRIAGRRMTARARTLAGVAQNWCQPGYLPVVHRSHLMNFHGSRVSVVLAPCR
jgi:hypothetical protein